MTKLLNRTFLHFFLKMASLGIKIALFCTSFHFKSRAKKSFLYFCHEIVFICLSDKKASYFLSLTYDMPDKKIGYKKHTNLFKIIVPCYLTSDLINKASKLTHFFLFHFPRRLQPRQELLHGAGGRNQPNHDHPLAGRSVLLLLIPTLLFLILLSRPPRLPASLRDDQPHGVWPAGLPLRLLFQLVPDGVRGGRLGLLPRDHHRLLAGRSGEREVKAIAF